MLEILLADDEPTIRLSLGDALRSAGHNVTVAPDGAAALAFLQARLFDVLISDIRMPKVDGLAIFQQMRVERPDMDVLLITAHGDVTDAVRAMKEGAYDYLTKPFETDEVILRVARIAERHSMSRELQAARAALASRTEDTVLIGRSPPMRQLLARIETIAASEAPVLITGESGTGKELVAREIHRLGPRAKGPLVTVNCGAMPETLFEAELFGHERGAFTGAVKRRAGRFVTANGGTLFLDEVAELPMAVQAKMLRVLEEGIVQPLGTDKEIPVDVVVVSATNRILGDWIAEKGFREDLFYRLNVLDIRVPPMREREGDLPLLVEHFLRRFAPDPGSPPELSPPAWAALVGYSFPGNVRELEHAIRHAVVFSRGAPIGLEHLPVAIAGDSIAPSHSSTHLRSLAEAAKEFEREYLLRALKQTDGAKARAAELLGITRKNLWEKLRAHGIGDSDAGSA